MCKIHELPEGMIFKMRIQESFFGFSVTVASSCLKEENILTGDKIFLRKKIKRMNVENGCLGVCYDDYARMEKIKTHLMCLIFSPKKYIRKLVLRKKVQRLNPMLKSV